MEKPDWYIEFERRMNEFDVKDREKINEISRTVKEMVRTKSHDRAQLDALFADLQGLRRAQGEVANDAMRRIGITEAELEALEEERRMARGKNLTDGLIRRTD